METKIPLKIFGKNMWVSYEAIPQEKLYIKINCLRFGHSDDLQSRKEKSSLKTAWYIYWSNLGQKKRFSEKQARDIFEFITESRILI